MKIQVGKILKAQGIKGEVKLASLIDNAENFKNFKYLYINEQRIGVVSARPSGDFVFVKFSTVTDRNAAEGLRGLSVFADKEQLPIDEGRFFIDELIGCNVYLNDDTLIGELVEILQNGSADVYVAKKDNGKKVLFPLIKDLTIKIDVDARAIILDAKRFSEVSVDED